MEWGIKGNIVYTKTPNNFEILKDGIIICEDNKIIDVFKELPHEYKDIAIHDYGSKIVMPGLVDLHLHAPQTHFMGTGMDLELMDWLYTYTFPEESKFSNLEYGEKIYKNFVSTLVKSPTTRASIFATLHVDTTIKLMDLLDKTGLITYVGKVNMDRDCPPTLKEASAKDSLSNTVDWLEKIKDKYINTYPIVTPRFIPTCSNELLEGLGEISEKYNIPNQSHLSETRGEMQIVKRLHPQSKFYGDIYYNYGLFGGDNKTIMAHCVYSTNEEIELMKKQGVFIAHCPISNTCLASGIAPAQRYLSNGLSMGLGSDVGAGYTLSIFKVIVSAISVSKLRWKLVDHQLKPLNLSEAFYLATKGGGEFFGRVGSFEKSYELDALVIDDSKISYSNDDILQRLEKIIYRDDEVEIVSKYVNGKKLY